MKHIKFEAVKRGDLRCYLTALYNQFLFYFLLYTLLHILLLFYVLLVETRAAPERLLIECAQGNVAHRYKLLIPCTGCISEQNEVDCFMPESFGFFFFLMNALIC